jgi:hypothetical protein
VGRFGLDPDEFRATGHWPHQLYIREGRRMVSQLHTKPLFKTWTMEN